MNAPFAYADVEPKKRSRLLGIGLGLMAAGLVVAVVFGILGWRNLPEPASFPRASGQSQPVELTAGDWTIFAEGGGTARPTEIVGPDGQTIVIDTSFGSQTYNLDGFSGVAVGTITAPVDGQYLVTTAAGQTSAYTQSFASSLFASVGLLLAAVFAGGGMIAVGILLTVIGFVKSR